MKNKTGKYNNIKKNQLQRRLIWPKKMLFIRKKIKIWLTLKISTKNEDTKRILTLTTRVFLTTKGIQAKKNIPAVTKINRGRRSEKFDEKFEQLRMMKMLLILDLKNSDGKLKNKVTSRNIKLKVIIKINKEKTVKAKTKHHSHPDDNRFDSLDFLCANASVVGMDETSAFTPTPFV